MTRNEVDDHNDIELTDVQSTRPKGSKEKEVVKENGSLKKGGEEGKKVDKEDKKQAKKGIVDKKKIKKKEEKKDEKKKDEKEKKMDKKKIIKKDDEIALKRRRRLIRHGKKYELEKARRSTDAVSIDWETDEGQFETTADQKKLRILALESELNDLKRENMNLLNEIAHMKPDLDKKTEMIAKHDVRMDRFKEDFERYKLRVMKEKGKSMKYASERLALNLLEVMDNMDRAITETKMDANVEDVISALRQMNKQMSTILEKEGIKPIEAVNKPFNPKYHEAIAKEQDDTIPDSTVIEEFQKGYMYKDKILRVSRVKVSHTDKIPAIKIEVEPSEKEKKEKDKEEKEKRGKEIGRKEVKEEVKVKKKDKDRIDKKRMHKKPIKDAGDETPRKSGDEKRKKIKKKLK